MLHVVKRGCSKKRLHAVTMTQACMQLHKLACRSMSLHAVTCFVWAAHKNFAELVYLTILPEISSHQMDNNTGLPSFSESSSVWLFPTAPQASTLYKLFESKVVLNVRGTWYFLRGTWYFAQNRMLEVMDGSGEAQKPFFWYPPFCPCEAGFVSILQTLHSISSQKHFSAKVKKTKVA